MREAWQARITAGKCPIVNALIRHPRNLLVTLKGLWIVGFLPKSARKFISPCVEPITFQPLYMERIWGGRQLQDRYQRALPEHSGPIGEAWEIVDRAEFQSVVDHGPFEGATLHQLWCDHRREIFGACPDSERFPLLLKILDCRDDLSIQVHPPASIAGQLNGEPKNEMWYIADHQPGAKLHVGLTKGTSRESLEKAIADGEVASCVHSLEARSGESIYIPSGRLHAIGGGFLIHEIQQNSDTTYRVFDWNRVGLDGQPRELHIEASLQCIDFDDVEPSMSAECDHQCAEFHTRRHSLAAGERIGNPLSDRFSIISVLEGTLQSEEGRSFVAGDSLILPQGGSLLTAQTPVRLLQTITPDPSL